MKGEKSMGAGELSQAYEVKQVQSTNAQDYDVGRLKPPPQNQKGYPPEAWK